MEIVEARNAYFKYLSTLLEIIPDALIISDKNGVIILINDQTEKLFGYTSEELLDHNVEMLVPKRYLEKHRQARAEYFKAPFTTSQSKESKLCALHKDGHEFPIEFRLSPIEIDNAVFSLATLRDMSKHKKLEDALRNKTSELEQVNLSKDKFLSTMSHELRTPLNSIIGYTGMLLMKLPGPINEEQEKQLRTVKTSAEHLLSLINDVLDIAKIESGKKVMNWETVNCEEIMHEVGSTLTPSAKAKGIEFRIKEPTTSLKTRTDKRALTEILLNLASNAIKFTDKGFVEINTELDDDYIHINVIDTGIGIATNDKNKVFDAFEQLKTPGLHPEGTGLGLHLSQKLAELMGGKIEVQSEPDKGSKFSIVIPKNHE